MPKIWKRSKPKERHQLSEHKKDHHAPIRIVTQGLLHFRWCAECQRWIYTGRSKR